MSMALLVARQQVQERRLEMRGQRLPDDPCAGRELVNLKARLLAVGPVDPVLRKPGQEDLCRALALQDTAASAASHGSADGCSAEQHGA
jgi:hypothetical protein